MSNSEIREIVSTIQGILYQLKLQQDMPNKISNLEKELDSVNNAMKEFSNVTSSLSDIVKYTDVMAAFAEVPKRLEILEERIVRLEGNLREISSAQPKSTFPLEETIKNLMRAFAEIQNRLGLLDLRLTMLEESSGSPDGKTIREALKNSSTEQKQT